MLVGSHAKVLDSLTCVPLSAQQDSVGTGRCAQSELVKGDGLATSLEDTLLGRSGEPEGGNGQLGDLQETDIIGDSSNDNDDFRVAFRGISSLFYDAR